ncbi:unnamed protein product [Rhodiola kirilowii]
MEVDDDDLPEFFKVYISQHSSKQMLIPIEFGDYMGERKSGSAELVSSSGQTWRVELVEDGKDLYFTDGWPDFVEDNMIQNGEFLFFKFHGNLMFSVVIYDENMCEKGQVSLGNCSRGRNGILEAGKELNGNRPVKRESAGPSQLEGPLLHSEDKIAGKPAFSVKPFFEKSITISHINKGAYLNLPNSFIQEHSLRYESNEKMVLRTSRNSSWKVNIIKYPGKILLRRGWGIFARENSIRVGDVCKFELLHRLDMMVHVVHCQERTGQANVGMSTWELRSLKRTVGVSQPGLRRGSPFISKGRKSAASAMLSTVNPSFVLKMKKYNVKQHYILNIPSRFAQENTLCYQANEKMILRTKKGSSWTVNIIRNGNKTKCYYYFSRGWATFVHDNNIKEGDICEFEVLNRLEMKVHLSLSSKQR